MKKILSVLLCLCMLCSLLPAGAFAAYEDGLCAHHTAHDYAICGYVAPVEGNECGFPHENCGCTEYVPAVVNCNHSCTVESGCLIKKCVHSVHEGCGYSEGISDLCTCPPAEDGTVTCTGECGARNIPGSPCTHACSVQSGCYSSLPCTHTHGEDGCVFIPEQPAHSCDHVCSTELCGFVQHVDEQGCNYQCSECAALDGFQQDTNQQPLLTSADGGTERISIAGATINLPPEEYYTYTGGGIAPTVSSVMLGDKTLTSGTDYTVSYSNNVNAGENTGIVTVEGIGNYTGTATANFTIKPVSIEGATINLEGKVFPHTGQEIKPQVYSLSRSDGSYIFLTQDDYDVSYNKNTDPGEASVTVTGKGNATGTATANFTITSKQIPIAADFTFAPPASLVYTGSRIEATLTTDKDMGDVTLVYMFGFNSSEPVNVGSYIVVAKVSGSETYSAYDVTDSSWAFTIQQKPLTVTAENQDILLGEDIADDAYKVEGLVKDHKLTAALTADTSKATDNGTIEVGTVTVKAGETDVTNNYAITKKSGKLTVRERIDLSTSNPTISLEEDSYEYTGGGIEPTVSSVMLGGKTLTSGTDYTVSYSDNVNAGTATVTITGTGDYTGTATAEFTITKKPLTVTAENQDILLGEEIAEDAYKVEGLVKDHTLTAALTADTSKATDNGTINIDTVTVKAGETDVTNNYDITKKSGKLIVAPDTGDLDESNLKISLEKYSYEYTGKEIKPAVTVVLDGETLKEGTAYTVKYSDNIDVGRATVTITGLAEDKDEVRYLGFDITERSITPKLELSGYSFAFNNKPHTPSVKVYDGDKVIDSSEYVVSYSANQAIGTATVTVKDAAGGNYALKDATAQFRIVAGYTVTYGNGSGWIKNANYYLTFVCDGDFNKFCDIYIDGIKVGPQFYSVYSGSTVVTLYPSLHGLLSNGWHRLTFVYDDGYANTVFYVGPPSINAPVTGDDSSIGLLSTVMALGLLGSVCALVLLRRKKNHS